MYVRQQVSAGYTAVGWCCIRHVWLADAATALLLYTQVHIFFLFVLVSSDLVF